ncbi:MAG: response regulator [Lachnospiraceae bacterium]|nr:response regulator [Lachnospiraceae bacterium]
MHKLLFISNTQSYFNITIANQLKEAEYEILETTADTDEVNKIKDTISSLLIFVDEEMTGHQQELIFIKDKALENDTPIFLIGRRNEIDDARKFLPENLIQKEFVRPIDVGEIVKTVDDFVKKHGSHLKKKILVVDDSGAMLRNVKGWLEDKYQVALANSGAMAIKYLSLNRPDLVLLDYEMPVVDGKQVLEMMRTEMEFSDIPVIFLTSKSDKESVLKVMELKPEGYLLKTMPPEEIVRAIDDFFVKRKSSGK